MTRRTSLIVCAAALIGLIASTHLVAAAKPDKADAGKPIALKLKLTKGRSYYVETHSKMTQKINLGGQVMNQVIDSTIGLMESVEDFVEDTATLELHFDRMAMDMAAAPMPPMKYDSDAPDANGSNQLKQMFEPMLRKPMRMEITSAGEVKSFSGMDAIKEEVSKQAGRNPIWMQMQAAFSDEAARVEYGESRFEFLPDKPISVGESWGKERRRHPPGLGNATISNTEYKLTEVKMIDVDGHQRRVAMIDYSGTIKPDAEAPKKAGGGGMPAPELESGKTRGTITFDLKRGLPIRRENVNSMTLVMKGSPMGDLKVEVESDDAMTLVSRKARESQKAKRDSSSEDTDASKQDG